MRFTTLACAALALISTASAAKTNTMVQYDVTCQKTYIVKNGDTVSLFVSCNSQCALIYI